MAALERAGARIEVVAMHRDGRPRWLWLFDPAAIGLLCEVLWRHGPRAAALTGRLGRGVAARYRLPLRLLAHTPLALRHILAFVGARRSVDATGFDFVVANDLYCAVAGLIIARRCGAALIYDTHELQLFRNVSNSLTRVFWTFCFEQAVIEGARDVFVVCPPIARLYRVLFSPRALAVIENRGDLAGVHAGAQQPPAPEASTPRFVYFGSTKPGRGLRCFPGVLASTGGRLDIFTAADDVAGRAEREAALAGVAEGRVVVHALLADVATVLDVVGRQRPVISLCLLEDACLSYRLAMPNKLRESLASRLPVLCLEGTWLAAVVRRFDLGAVLTAARILDGAAPSAIAGVLNDWPRFEAGLEAYFRSRSAGMSFARYWSGVASGIAGRAGPRQGNPAS